MNSAAVFHSLQEVQYCRASWISPKRLDRVGSCQPYPCALVIARQLSDQLDPTNSATSNSSEYTAARVCFSSKYFTVATCGIQSTALLSRIHQSYTSSS